MALAKSLPEEEKRQYREPSLDTASQEWCPEGGFDQDERGPSYPPESAGAVQVGLPSFSLLFGPELK